MMGFARVLRTTVTLDEIAEIERLLSSLTIGIPFSVPFTVGSRKPSARNAFRLGYSGRRPFDQPRIAYNPKRIWELYVELPSGKQGPLREVRDSVRRAAVQVLPDLLERLTDQADACTNVIRRRVANLQASVDAIEVVDAEGFKTSKPAVQKPKTSRAKPSRKKR